MESESLEEDESHLIINAVKDANIPKFVAEDVPLFKRILADLFPGLDPPGPDNKLLKVTVLSGITSKFFYLSYLTKVTTNAFFDQISILLCFCVSL